MNYAAIANQANHSDRAVQKTDDDAAGSKLSAVMRGYYTDPYIAHFSSRPPVFRLPLINIGTYCRVMGIDNQIQRFLVATENLPSRTIVSLGAGSDTRAFQLIPQNANLDYYELDFPVKIAKKQSVISRNPDMQQVLLSGRLKLVPVDLRQIDDLVSTQLAEVGSNHQPVLVISECCLCYLPLAQSDRVLQFFSERCDKLSIVMYEPMSLHDEFGRVMAENMAQRGLVIPTLEHYATLADQKQRLAVQAQLSTVGAVDINTVYAEWLDEDDRVRISRLEFLDEVEEMQLLLRHYCIAWGSRNL